MANVKLTPRLVVRGADRALEFYRVFDARIEERFAEKDGHVGASRFSLGGVQLSLTEERREWGNSRSGAYGDPCRRDALRESLKR